MRTIGVVTSVLVVALVGVGGLTTTHAQKQKSQSSTQVATLSVPDMFCEGCAAGVKIAANKVDGVKGVKTDFDKRIAEVTFDPSKTSAEAIASAITKGTGFKTEVLKSGKTSKT